MSMSNLTSALNPGRSLPSSPTTPAEAESQALRPSFLQPLSPEELERRAAKRRYRHSLPIRAFPRDSRRRRDASGSSMPTAEPRTSDEDPAFGALLGLPAAGSNPSHLSLVQSRETHETVPSLSASQTSTATNASVATTASLASEATARVPEHKTPQSQFTESTTSLASYGRPEPLRACHAAHARLHARAAVKVAKHRAAMSAVSLPLHEEFDSEAVARHSREVRDSRDRSMEKNRAQAPSTPQPKSYSVFEPRSYNAMLAEAQAAAALQRTPSSSKRAKISSSKIKPSPPKPRTQPPPRTESEKVKAEFMEYNKKQYYPKLEGTPYDFATSEEAAAARAAASGAKRDPALVRLHRKVWGRKEPKVVRWVHNTLCKPFG